MTTGRLLPVVILHALVWSRSSDVLGPGEVLVRIASPLRRPRLSVRGVLGMSLVVSNAQSKVLPKTWWQDCAVQGWRGALRHNKLRVAVGVLLTAQHGDVGHHLVGDVA